jgi:DNA-binding NarL/FixJ family response regulator
MSTPRKLKPADVDAIRAALARGEPQTSIAERFNVHRSIISHIRTGRLFRDPDAPIPPPQRRSHKFGKKLTAAAVIEIRKLLAAGVLSKEIARRFGCSAGNVACIKRGFSWRHV